MRWRGRQQSRNVEDRRGQRMPAGRAMRGGGGLLNILLLGFVRASPKVKLIMIVIAAVAFLFFRGPLVEILGLSSATSPGIQQTGEAPNDEMEAYLSTMMADNESIWPPVLTRYGIDYRPCKMVIYTGRTMTKGGLADARSGPFYAPSEETIYIDPTFFRELKERFGATGDFAEAYVVAHEYAHHVQNLMGRLDELHKLRGRMPTSEYNKRSVRVELHADFLAGVFAKTAESTFSGFLEAGDIEEAMRCAAAIGDDRIQAKYGSGKINPESFTHGTSEQRVKWFNEGVSTGDLRRGEALYSLPFEQL
ncbi:MAG: neutral zinc metallopeptidase [Verrucomicrobiales bacterium]|nr:neutral zinc metallopeptidase [Verrucomicrobiales bacterium]